MTKTPNDKAIFYLSLPLAVLIFTNSYFGLFVSGTYSRETFSWYVQAVGQDIVDLFLIVPFLVITSILAYKQNRTAVILWGGVNSYIIYSYVIFCFGTHFNSLFLVYCFALGLSFYSFAYFLLLHIKRDEIIRFPENIPVRTIGTFLLVIACLFYLVWLKDIIPAIAGNIVPKSLIESGMITNPVHVLDLSIFLPALILTAILLLKKKALGLLLTPVMLVFCSFMALAISALIIVMKLKGLKVDLPIAIVFDIISLVSSILLVIFIRHLKKIDL